MDLEQLYPPHALRDYALIADGERGALVGPRGDIAWMCAPSWDSDAIFSTLVGGSGCYSVTPSDRFVWGGWYEPRSLIWRSRWVTTRGIVESREALAAPSIPGRAVILRSITVVEGRVSLRTMLDVRPGFGTQAMGRLRRSDDGVWHGRSGGLSFSWSGAPRARRSGSGPLMAEFELGVDEHVELVFSIGSQDVESSPLSAEELWRSTEQYWDGRNLSVGTEVLAPRDTELSLAVMTGLTASTGGMVAAATMSLPERADEGRNYDYRYAWIRDQCFAGRASALHGQFDLFDSLVGFVTERVLADGERLPPATTVRGTPVPDEYHLEHLRGYPGGTDVVGNWVNGQFQLDVFGEVLELLAVADELGRLDGRGWEAISRAVEAIVRRGGEPDAGIWEIDPERWTQSRLSCISGLRAAARRAPSNRANEWSSLADRILADVGSCVHQGGWWIRSEQDARVDAALLVPIIRGVLPIDDPRCSATIDAVEAQLTEEEFVYRFQPDSHPLGEAEGAFVLCGFLLAIARSMQGRQLRAQTLFDRNRSICGTPGLFSEEFDVTQRQLRGNLPQAFVHAVMAEAAAVLGRADLGPGGLIAKGWRPR